MDFSEVIPVVGALAAAGLAGAVCWRMRWVASRSLRWALTGVTGLLGVGALLVAGGLVFFDLNYTRHPAPQVSPDGRYLAITSYTVGTGTGADEVEVALRRAWSPYAHRVYTGRSQYEPNAATPEPEVRWVDTTHLEIRFHTYVSSDAAADGEQGCAGEADGIQIACVETRVHAVK